MHVANKLFVSLGAAMLVACSPPRTAIPAVANTAATVATTASGFGELLTPPGIGLNAVGGGKRGAVPQTAFTTVDGFTLYTYSADKDGNPTCTQECAEKWRPAVAPSDAVASGDWSIVESGGVRQWVHMGHPLYRYAADPVPGAIYGNNPLRFGQLRKGPDGKLIGRTGNFDEKKPADDVPLPDEWKVAAVVPPAERVALPRGFSLVEVGDASGLTLVDRESRTLYVFTGASREIKDIGADWIPVEGAWIGAAVGDFTLIARDSGVNQWHYKGLPLYRYAADPAPDYAEGIGKLKGMQAATLYRYYRPTVIAVQNSVELGKVLSDAATGKTLYRRDAHQDGRGHTLRHATTLRPDVGRDIGTKTFCPEAQCSADWSPYPAPASLTVPQGHWSFYTREDGARQLTYQGYALWTYKGDEAPGDINGNDIQDYLFSGIPSMPDALLDKFIETGTPWDSPAGYYWAAMQP